MRCNTKRSWEDCRSRGVDESFPPLSASVHVDESLQSSDCRVNVTFVNYMGERKTIRGFVGQTLTQMAVENEYLFLARV